MSFREGRHEVYLYGETITTDFSFKLAGWKYPVAFLREQKELKFDNFNGHWGEESYLNQLQQEYTLQTVERSEDVQQYVNEGWMTERQKQPNGDIHVVLTR